MGKDTSQQEAADLIVRFIEDRLIYPQEWNDFVDCRQSDPTVERVRKMCEELDPLVNRPGPQDQVAIEKLRGIAEQLMRVSQYV